MLRQTELVLCCHPWIQALGGLPFTVRIISIFMLSFEPWRKCRWPLAPSQQKMALRWAFALGGAFYLQVHMHLDTHISNVQAGVQALSSGDFATTASCWLSLEYQEWACTCDALAGVCLCSLLAVHRVCSHSMRSCCCAVAAALLQRRCMEHGAEHV